MYEPTAAVDAIWIPSRLCDHEVIILPVGTHYSVVRKERVVVVVFIRDNNSPWTALDDVSRGDRNLRVRSCQMAKFSVKFVDGKI